MTTSPQYTAHVDGACTPVNPGGTASWGWVLEHDGRVDAAACGVVGKGQGMTNNVAEYHGLLSLLEHLSKCLMKQVTIRADSQLMVRQISGEYATNAPNLIPLRAMAAEAVVKSGHILVWIPREQNSEADALSLLAVDEPGLAPLVVTLLCRLRRGMKVANQVYKEYLENEGREFTERLLALYDQWLSLEAKLYDLSPYKRCVFHPGRCQNDQALWCHTCAEQRLQEMKRQERALTQKAVAVVMPQEKSEIVKQAKLL